MEQMKVLHVIGGGEFGGAEQHLLTLIKHLKGHGLELHVACLFAAPLAGLVAKDGFPVHVFTMSNKIDLKPVGQLASLIKKEGFHIIHTHGVRANLIGRLAAKRAGCTHVVTTVHSVLAFDYSRWLDKWVNRLTENFTRNITEKFITVSEMLARQLQKEGIPEDRITTVHNGLEIENYDPALSGDAIRKEFNIDAHVPVMGIVARLHPVKGHPFLLEAMAEANKKHPDLLLLVIGSGPELEGLKEMSSRLGIDKNVIFAGFRKDIPEIIAALDFVVLPSLSEGLSITVMEGMAMKKPVLATAVGGTPEIITSGVNGLLVPPADSGALASGIQQLVSDNELARTLGEQARKTIEDGFTARLMADKTVHIYTDIVKGGLI